MTKSAEVERWFASTKPPSEAALRRVRDIILAADPSMRERPVRDHVLVDQER